MVLDPPYLQTMSNVQSTETQVNTLSQINAGLSGDMLCTTENFTKKILQSCLDCTEPDALFFIWCSMEQALEYQKIHFSKELQPEGLKALSVCVVNGKKRNTGADVQLPSTTGEFFVVGKKGNAKQACFDKWGVVYEEEEDRPKFLENTFKVPSAWWDRLSTTRYPYEKPRQLMRLFVNYFAQPGQLVFEGFAGTISCGLAALTRNVNLVAVDNNVDTAGFLKSLYSELNTGILDLEGMGDTEDEYDEHEPAQQFVSKHWLGYYRKPVYQLFGPEEFGETSASQGVRQPNFPGSQRPSTGGKQLPMAQVYTGEGEESSAEESAEESAVESFQGGQSRKRPHSSDEEDNASHNSFHEESQDY